MRTWSTGLLLFALSFAAVGADAPSSVKPAAAQAGTDPKALSTPAPDFPAGVTRRGVVVLEMEVKTDGSIGKVWVSHPSGEAAYDAAALAAAKNWKFRPATDAAGETVPSVVRVPVTFAPPISANNLDELGIAVRDTLKQSCAEITLELAAFRQQDPAARIEDAPTFKATTGMVFATAIGRSKNEMVKLANHWNATLPAVYAQVANECAAHPATVYEDVWAQAAQAHLTPPN